MGRHSYDVKINTKGKKYYFRIGGKYYKVISGDIFPNYGDYFMGFDIEAVRMKCTFRKTDLHAIDNFENKKFFHEDIFEYLDDETERRSFKNKVLYHVVELKHEHLYRSVLYADETDKYRNFDKPNCFKVINSDREILF
jgi:hypothetical protein